MRNLNLENKFKHIWLVDFEFRALPGERQDPVCLVGVELKSGRTIKMWQDELSNVSKPPYSISQDSLFVAYYASAELGCHLSLNWPLPVNVLDLFTEFRNLTNGLRVPCGNGLLGALTYFGINAMDTIEKDSMRDLAIRGGPWTSDERKALLEYCESDVVALKKLLNEMPSTGDLSHSLLRGRFMKAIARIEFSGVPLDKRFLGQLQEHWNAMEDVLIKEVDRDYGIFEGRTFKYERFRDYLIRKNIPWPYLESGRLDLKDETFKEMSKIYPDLLPLRQLRDTLSKMRLSNLTVGQDGYNRCLLSPFQSKTGRNQPSSAKFIFGPSKWIRGLIKPHRGKAISYIDWEQQEFGIAAALSGDANMLEAYRSGDPYLAFAKQAHAVPTDATKGSHEKERELFKTCALGVQYGMGKKALASRIKKPDALAKNLLRLHKRTYPEFWQWSDSAVNHALLKKKLPTVYGWNLHVEKGNRNSRSFRNFPMQANGAEMLRLACCYLTEAGITVCCPIHDAILIEAPVDDIDAVSEKAQALMAKASSIVLGGFTLRTEAKIVKYPGRYMDKGGEAMWNRITSILERLEKKEL